MKIFNQIPNHNPSEDTISQVNKMKNQVEENYWTLRNPKIT